MRFLRASRSPGAIRCCLTRNDRHFVNEQLSRIVTPASGAAAERFQAMGHYRIYQLDPSDHITAGFSVECGSDTAAMRAARTLLELEQSAGVEVWKKRQCWGL